MLDELGAYNFFDQTAILVCVAVFCYCVIPAFCLSNIVQYGLILKNIVASHYGSLEAEGPESHHVELFCSKSCSLDL